MPKPTTHTDIVVVTKQDPSNSAVRGSESVQVTLSSDAASSATDIHTTPLVESRPKLDGVASIGSGLAAMGLSAGTKRLELGYEVKITYGDAATYGKVTTEPRGWGDDAPTPSELGKYTWKHADANRALIANLELLVYGKLEDGTLTATPDHSSSGGLTTVKVEFEDQAQKVVGTLQFTAVMEAQLV